jgi:tetratricopeptide (TPR) repeat protein
MMKQIPMSGWLIVTATLLVLGTAMPVTADDKADCDQSNNLDLRIRGCTGLIASGELESGGTAAAYIRRGNAYRGIGDYGRAIADNHKAVANYDEAVQLKPDDATIYYNRGSAYRAKGDSFRSAAGCDGAVPIKLDYSLVFNSNGASDYDNAIADYGRAIELREDYATAYNGRGSVYRSIRDYDKAIADYSKAIEFRAVSTPEQNPAIGRRKSWPLC